MSGNNQTMAEETKGRETVQTPSRATGLGMELAEVPPVSPLVKTLADGIGAMVIGLPPMTMGEVILSVMEHLHTMPALENEVKGQVLCQAFQHAYRSCGPPVSSELRPYMKDLPIMVPILQSALKFSASQGGIGALVSDGLAQAASAVSSQAGAVLSGLNSFARRAAVTQALDSVVTETGALPVDDAVLLRVIYKAAFPSTFAARGRSTADEDAEAVAEALRFSPHLASQADRRARLVANMQLYGPVVFGVVKRSMGLTLTSAMATGQATLTQLVQSGANLVVDQIGKCCAWGKAKAKQAAFLQMAAPVVGGGAGAGGAQGPAASMRLQLPVPVTTTRQLKKDARKQAKAEKVAAKAAAKYTPKAV